MITYLIASFCTVLSNCLCVYFVQKGYIVLEKGQIIMDVFLHNNIICMFLFVVLHSILKVKGKADYSFKDTFSTKKDLIQFALFVLPVIAAVYKTYMLGFVPVTTITISSMIMPFAVWLLALLFLKEKLNLSFIKYGVLSVVGFIFVNLQKLQGGGWSFGYIHYLLFYILLESTGQITLRYYCAIRKHTLQAVMAELTIFFVYGSIFLFARNTFSWQLLLNPFAWIVAICSFLRNTLLVFSVRRASSIVALEFCAFSKPIFACIIMYVLVGEVPTWIKAVGMLIIGVAMVKFHGLERKAKAEKKANMGIGQKLFNEKTIEKVEELNEDAQNKVKKIEKKRENKSTKNN